MEVTINNLGPIREETSIEIKPLTVFVGPNNAGKTWTAYALSALFGLRSCNEYRNSYLSNKTRGVYPSLDNAVIQLLDFGSAKINLIDFFNESGEYYFNNLGIVEKDWIQDFLGSSNANFADMKISVNLKESNDQIAKNILSYGLKASFFIGKDGNALLNVLKEKNNSDILFYTSNSDISDNTSSDVDLKKRFPKKVIEDIIISNVFRIISRSVYFDIYFFPSERIAFTDLIQLFMIPSKMENLRSNKIENDSEMETDGNEVHNIGLIISDPIMELISLLKRTMREGSYSKRQKEIEGDGNIEIFLQLAEILQKEILQGNVDYSDPEPNPLRELIFKPSDPREIALDIPVASSMVKELSPLVLYLRYLANKRNLLVIDEPEMNLHPEAQAKLIEFIAMLVNSGIQVIITTHSPYIVDHLINLMKAASLENLENIRDKFYLKNSKAFISKDNVSVYLFADGKAKNILEEDGFIEWETFNQVSQKILDLRMEL
jgi:AAA ATPase domain